MHEELKTKIEALINSYEGMELDPIAHNSLQVLRGLMFHICMNTTGQLAKQTFELSSKIMSDLQANQN